MKNVNREVHVPYLSKTPLHTRKPIPSKLYLEHRCLNVKHHQLTTWMHLGAKNMAFF